LRLLPQWQSPLGLAPGGLEMKKVNFTYLKFRVILSLAALASLAAVLSAGRRWV